MRLCAFTLQNGPHICHANNERLCLSAVYTNKHREIGTKGETVKEVTGPWEWKIEGPMVRWTTLEQAIKYVSLMRDKTDDPVIKKNAEKTIATLKRLGNAAVTPARVQISIK